MIDYIKITDRITCECWVVEGDYEEDVNFQHRELKLLKVLADGKDITGYSLRFKDIKSHDCEKLGEYRTLDGQVCPEEVDALFEYDDDFFDLEEKCKEKIF
jgi:hypothetical protein